MNTNETTIETTQAATANTSNWMTELASLLFWITVFLQIGMLLNDIKDKAFTDFVYLNVLPLTGALAYFGLKRQQKANAECTKVTGSIPETDC